MLVRETVAYREKEKGIPFPNGTPSDFRYIITRLDFPSLCVCAPVSIQDDTFEDVLGKAVPEQLDAFLVDFVSL